MRKPALLLILLALLAIPSFAQKAQISGKISDTTEKRNLYLATITLIRKSDSSLVTFSRADQQGKFTLPKVDTGEYVLMVTYPRFADFIEKINVKGDLEMGAVNMTPASKLLDAVIVRSTGSIRIKGDTTEFVADSFKVKEGATVEDLLKKLPGLTVNSKGEIQAQGKRVDKVLVDGEEFFGDDPTMATQNISAKAVDRVQVFDTKTEQQKLTGMTTGNEGKTVNIKLKEDAKKGAFGKAYGGTDFHKYFDSKVYYNNFVGKKKASVYGTRSNVNTGSLNWDDRQKLGMENDLEFDEISGFYFSFGGGDEFNDWNIRGLPDAWTGGALFTNKWNQDKHNLNISYRYNRLTTSNIGTTLTQNILPTGLTYSNKYNTRKGLNVQHALNGKYEWKIDSLASIKLVVAQTFKNSHTRGFNRNEFLNGNKDSVNQSFNEYDNYTDREQLDNQLTYKQLFKKKNRLWQTTVRYGVTDDDNHGLNFTRIRYFDANGVFNHADTVDQQKLFDGKSTTLGLKTTFTEPLSDKWMLVLDYGYNKNHSKSFRNTYEKGLTGKYEDLVPDFSSNFELDAYSNSGSAIFRYTGKKMRAGIGSGISDVKLKLKDIDNLTVNRYHFFNITPQAQVNFMPKTQFNIGINYRGNTIQPTINQLQPLRDNTDPLNEYIGNPNLKVGFNHSINIFLNQYKVLSQSWIGFNMGINKQQNAVTQFNTIDLTTGKRTFYPININGNMTWWIWSNYNKSKGNKKPNYGFGFNGNGGKYNNYVNGQLATTRSFSMNLNLNLGIESEDKFDFSINPRVGYNSSKSSLSTAVNNNFWSYGGSVNAEVELPWKVEIESNVNFDLRQKLDAFGTNNNLIVWSGSISKKIFKKDAGKIGIYMNDILNQNKGFSRTINSTFITEDRYQRIGQYFLLKFEWSFTKAPGGGAETK